LIYWPVWQESSHSPRLVAMIETAGDPRSMMSPVLAAVRSVNDQVRPLRFATMDEHLRLRSEEIASSVWFFAAFGALGLLLATAGLYAVVAFAVSQRTFEIGVRMALGASRQAVWKLVLRRGLSLALWGALSGLPIAWYGVQLLRSVNSELVAMNPWHAAAIAIVLAVVTLLASFVPARRAARVDPMYALRCE
jgi:macrolide transport system ATP-binding/permease protein